MNTWLELTNEERAAIWDRFYAEFQFKPDYNERVAPAIAEPRPFVTFDLSSTTLDDENALFINDLLLNSFQSLASAGDMMYWLDWQHACYRFDPQFIDDSWTNSWYPDGDYYIFLASDFSFGTFGHPWQQSLCVFGASLLGVAETLRGKLEVIRESTH